MSLLICNRLFKLITTIPRITEEFNQLKADLTGRYTNNELKKQTPEIIHLIRLTRSSPSELHRIAQNDATWTNRNCGHSRPQQVTR
ncbi:MAG: hypothetical protein CM15mP47_4660 [Methanobacteriota archaeon]|nr:MAG: hypothetical protein CM15mP47_4660 [Euryarchaeota archaeon]